MADKKRLPSTFLNMVVVLSAIAIVSALALGFTYSVTKEAIAQVEVKRTMAALKKVLPDFDNNPQEEKYTVKGYEEMEFYPAKKGGQTIGTAIKTFSDKGFNERIWIMVGLTKDHKINKISVLKHKETPGLGTRMAKPKFLSQFYGKDPANFNLMVKKDGGDVDALSAATVTSRAFCEAAKRAYQAILKGDKK
jgi:electron transport complex protein RnfG